MNEAAVDHPDLAQLSDFGTGKLMGRDLIARIERHLEVCAPCRAAVESATDDAFVSRIKQAANDGHLPTMANDGNLPTLSPHGNDEVPAELRQSSRFRVRAKLGEGGMGAVYMADQVGLDRPVVLKVIRPEHVADPEALERFRREALAVAQLSHPNIVKVFDIGDEGGLQFIVMEFVEGVNLARLVREQGPLPVRRACDLGRQAALAVRHAHEKEVLHRDLKPLNLMASGSDQLTVLDFGLARLARCGTQLTGTAACMGTPEYMPPEQWRDLASVDGRADIYSLGCTLYFLLTGQPPFRKANQVELLTAHLEEEPPALAAARPDVPANLAGLVARMLAKSPEDRPDAAEVAGELERIGKAGDTVPFVAAPPPRRRWPAWLAAGLLLAAAGVAAGVVMVLKIDGGKAQVEIQVDQEGCAVTVDGREISITPVGEKAIKLEVVPGKEYELKVSKDGFETTTRTFTYKKGGESVVRVSLLPAKEEAKAVAKTDAAPPPEKKPAAKTARHLAYITRGKWVVEGDSLVNSRSDRPSVLRLADRSITAFTYTLTAERVNGSGGFAMSFHTLPNGIFSNFLVGGDSGDTFNLLHQRRGKDPKAAPKAKSWEIPFRNFASLRDGLASSPRTYKARVNVTPAGNGECQLDGVTIYTFKSPPPKIGAVGLVVTPGSTFRFRDIQITEPGGQVIFEGVPEVRFEGKMK